MKHSTPLPEAAETAALTTHVSPADSDPATPAATESAFSSEQHYTTAPGASTEPSAAPVQPVVAIPAQAVPCKWPLPNIPGLSISQRTALAALIAGKGPNESARIAGVDRSTLYRWRTDDIDFIAALNVWRQQAMETTVDCLRNGAQYAALTIVNAARDGNVAASLALLKGLGALAPHAPGPQTPDAVRQAIELKEMVEYNKSVEDRADAIDDRLFASNVTLQKADCDESESHAKKLAELEKQESATAPNTKD